MLTLFNFGEDAAGRVPGRCPIRASWQRTVRPPGVECSATFGCYFPARLSKSSHPHMNAEANILCMPPKPAARTGWPAAVDCGRSASPPARSATHIPGAQSKPRHSLTEPSLTSLPASMGRVSWLAFRHTVDGGRTT
ncbi:hypothetical protein LZ31DRAFT_177839 [Colletotrichum somersetense]|nr:hypothetical protein LZ31DRAFT_177839 [Colletotrichum somersetense]